VLPRRHTAGVVKALPEDLEDLPPLIDRLASCGYPHTATVGRWKAMRVPRGRNNVVYRAGAGTQAVAVKFTTPDGRDRAGREHRALLALTEAGLDIAPKPLGLIRDGLPHPVVIGTWLEGTVSDEPPASDGEWDHLVRHYAAIHTVTHAGRRADLPMAVMTMTGAAAGRALLRAEVERLLPVGVPPEIADLLRLMTAARLPDLVAPRHCLCRCDTNIGNVIRRDDGWASVDWEYAGWGDAAFELADLTSHPAHQAVTRSCWRRVAEMYSACHDDKDLLERAGVYEVLMTCWWEVRFTRMITGPEPGRLSSIRLDPDDARTRQRGYLARAYELLDRSG
jgi:aminoglycoside phosphotransferase (APT) family kinase protein